MYMKLAHIFALAATEKKFMTDLKVGVCQRTGNASSTSTGCRHN